MAILRFIIGLIITIFIAAFAVLNREEVLLTWSPIHDPITLPIYAVALASMAIGFIIGGTIVWLNAGKVRKEKRKQKKNIKILEKELSRLKDGKFTATVPTTEIIQQNK